MVHCYSKSTILVLVWSLILFTVMWFSSEFKDHLIPIQGILKSIVSTGFVALPTVVICTPFSGWLADSRCGNFKVFKVGSIVLFIGVLLTSIHTCILKNLTFSQLNDMQIFNIIIGVVCNLLVFSGGSACIVTVFQLGLDQMPDASSAELVAYIKWFSLTLGTGLWFGDVLNTVVLHCTDHVELAVQIQSLFPVAFTSILLCTLFIFGQKWLIIEPKSPQSLKNIFRVLKFAAKHKSPSNRSAFTYWEEDIPSRIDLGKSKYGGPFTTEQVEDVKTFLRLLIVFLPVYAALFSTNIYGTADLLKYPLQINQLYNSSCVYSLFSKFTYSPWWCGTIAFIVYTLILHRIIKHYLPSTLMRIGGLSLLLALFNITYSTYSITTVNSPNEPNWPFIAYTIISSSPYALFASFLLEFVCAQSPYSMRGLLSGVAFFNICLFTGLGSLVSLMFRELCPSQTCKICHLVLGGSLGVVSFILHLVLARWYKLRVRNEDEEYNTYWQITVKIVSWILSRRNRQRTQHMPQPFNSPQRPQETY